MTTSRKSNPRFLAYVLLGFGGAVLGALTVLAVKAGNLVLLFGVAVPVAMMFFVIGIVLFAKARQLERADPEG